MGEGDLIEDKVRLTGASEEGARGHIQHPMVVGWVAPPEDSQAGNCASPLGVISYEIQPAFSNTEELQGTALPSK